MNSLAQQPILILGIILGYFLLLVLIGQLTSKGSSDNKSFFSANRSSPWLLVAIGMIGASLSGVTFISIPGVVGKDGLNADFSYMQVVFGYLLGYLVIATVLMPIYYRLNLTSIYSYLEQRFGFTAYKTGAGYFLLSRLVQSAFRLFLVVIVLDKFVLGPMGVHFILTSLITILLIWVYTFKGGIKTIVVTDVFQTVTMLTAVVLTLIGIASSLNLGLNEMIAELKTSDYSKLWHFENGWSDPNNFFKQFFSGALIALVMTGLDQDMMQKNLTCRTLGDAQKNMFTFSIILIFANILFLSLGAMLYIYASKVGYTIPDRSDYLYPTVALEQLSPFVGIAFILGLIAAAYSSADSALTALTTSFCVDFLNMEKKEQSEESRKTRIKVHIGMSFLLFFIIIVFFLLNDDAVINSLFKMAGYTYGPLLGLFAFGILTKRKIVDKWSLLICLLAPIFTYIIESNSEAWFNGLKLGFLNLALNGLLTFLGLWMISKKP